MFIYLFIYAFMVMRIHSEKKCSKNVEKKIVWRRKFDLEMFTYKKKRYSTLDFCVLHDSVFHAPVRFGYLTSPIPPTEVHLQVCSQKREAEKRELSSIIRGLPGLTRPHNFTVPNSGKPSLPAFYHPNPNHPFSISVIRSSLGLTSRVQLITKE